MGLYTKRIVGINLLVLLVAAGLFRFAHQGVQGGGIYIERMAEAMAGLLLLDLYAAAMVTEYRPGFLWGALLVLLLGVGLIVGGLFIY